MPTSSAESELIQRLLNHEKAAWRQFVGQYQGLVYARVLRTGMQRRGHLDRADVEDICAEVFASLLANDLASLRSFEGRSSLSTWLAVIARRICLKYLDRLPTDQARGSSLDGAVDSHATDRSTDALEQLIRAEDHQRLRAHLGRLNPGDQQILDMYYNKGLGYNEISQRLGISVNTVGPKLHRAQSRLRKLLRTV